MKEIKPILVWVCPQDHAKFTSIEKKCINSKCIHFFRIKTDVNLGDNVIACKYDEFVGKVRQAMKLDDSELYEMIEKMEE